MQNEPIAQNEWQPLTGVELSYTTGGGKDSFATKPVKLPPDFIVKPEPIWGTFPITDPELGIIYF